MKISTSQDFDVPIDTLYKRVTDFEMMERLALRRGIDVQHRDPTPYGEAGSIWDVRFDLRGRQRQLETKILSVDAPHVLRFEAVGTGIEADLAIDLVSLARSRTRLAFECVIRPKNMPARLLVQTLKLSRGRVKRRLTSRLQDFARRIENEYRRSL